MSKYLGDFSASSVIDFKFTTFRPSTGAPFTLAGTPVVSVYKDNDLVQTTTGVALTVDFDGVTGLNHVRVTTTDAFYANGSEFECVITTGTVDSVSVVGSCVGRFTLRSQASLYPTTAGNTLDVNVNGEAGVDWGNVGNQGSTVGLSATTVNTSTNVTNAVTVGTINNNVITATSIANAAITDTKIADNTITAAKFGDSALIIGNTAAGGVKAYLAANAVNATVLADNAITNAKIANNAITDTKIAADAITNAKIADSAITIRLSTDATASEGRLFAGAVAGDVWNALLADYVTANTFGARIIRARATSPQNEVTITGSYHIASDVHELQPGVITNADFSAGAIDANALAADAANEIADALLNRNVAGGSSAGRLVKEALYALRNKTEIVGSTLNVYNATDGAIAWFASLSTSALADPVTGIDPA